jgi:L-alanine-DL-glutamate epimerase-like enolase superfamily enzyme
MTAMRISRLRTLRLVGPDPHGLGAPRTWSILLVRVDADDGTFGLGEATDLPGVRQALERIEPQLIGRDPLEIRPIVREILYGALPPREPSMSQTAISSGPVAWAAAGVEIALHDLVGKALGVPVHALLGGAYRRDVRVYLDRSGPHRPEKLEAWAELGADAAARGFSSLKFDAEYVAPELTGDVWNRTASRTQIRTIVERIGAVRAAVGPDVELAVDCHMHYAVPTAVALAEALAPLDIAWLEDPVPLANPDALAYVRSRSPVPICAGEMFVPEQARLFVDRGACDILHPDICFAGGLTETRLIADYADLHYLPVALHNNGCALGTIAAAHLAATIPGFVGLEYHFADAAWIGEVVTRQRPLFEEGCVPLDDSPGFGIDLNEDVCARHLAPGETLFD